MRIAAIYTLLLGVATLAASAQTIDLDQARLQVAPIGTAWHFHPGDNPQWAQPGFDDSSWKLIKPSDDWDPQGYAEQNSLAWFRFRLKVPVSASSVVLSMPGVDKSYQVFANGVLVGQSGRLPPDAPKAIVADRRLFTISTKGAPDVNGKREITVALRLWQDPQLVGVSSDSLHGEAAAGAPDAMQRNFDLLKAESLLSLGKEYTMDIIALIVGAASLLLFRLTREAFYAWFGLDQLIISSDLILHLLSHHFAWYTLPTITGYTAEDALENLFFTLFLAGVLRVRDWRLISLPIVLNFIAECGPLLVVVGKISVIWGDALYTVFETMTQALFVIYLLRGWRAGLLDAKLFLIPYLASASVAALSNIGYFAISLGFPQGGKIITANIEILQTPFSVTLNDVTNLLSTAGFLAVLVYRFAQTSRERQRMASALQAAHDIQQRLVPVDIPSLGGLTTEIVYLAAEEVGGDFCQVLPLADSSVLVVIGDVSGKGLQAAMVGTLVVGALRSLADEQAQPAEILERLNHVLLRTENVGFVTCLCLHLRPDGEIIVANAGHLSPYLNGAEMPLEAGLPLGILSGVSYTQSSFTLPETARITLLSDGVVEARSANGELFGFDRASGLSELPASRIAAEAHRHGQEDDITVVTLDWRAAQVALSNA